MSEAPEVWRPRDEVGLAVDLNDRANTAPAVDVRLDKALKGDAVRLAPRLSESLLAEELRRLHHVAAVLFQCALGVHDAGAGLLPKLLDHCGGYHSLSFVL